MFDEKQKLEILKKERDELIAKLFEHTFYNRKMHLQKCINEFETFFRARKFTINSNEKSIEAIFNKQSAILSFDSDKKYEYCDFIINLFLPHLNNQHLIIRINPIIKIDSIGNESIESISCEINNINQRLNNIDNDSWTYYIDEIKYESFTDILSTYIESL